MALGKTIQYTPFEETSFGYGVGEIASAHSTEFPNGTDIVKLIMTFSGNWDNSTGHVSTPAVGTATSAYNKSQDQWAVVGQRDDVDSVLAELKFFPSDFAAARTWTPTPVLQNVTTGSYPMDEPSYVASIPDTTISLFIYDVNDTLIQSYQVIWDAIDPVYGNQRPYWTVEPQLQDVSGTGYDTVAGWTLDFGKISHGSDTENVTISCELRELGGSSPVLTRGSFTPYNDMYVSDKKPDVYTSGSGFSFTGSIAEAQAFFDNVRYNRITNTNKLTAEMFLKVNDGVLASAFTEYLYSSDKAPEFTEFPDQATTEETDLILNTTGFSLINTAEFPSTEVSLWAAEISIDATGQSGIDSCSETITNGVIVVSSSTLNGLITKLGTITFTFNADFNDEWTFELDITASDTLYSGVVWTATQQTVNVTISDVQDYFIPPLSQRPNIVWNEDTFVNFDTELVITDQAYGGTATYQYEGIAYWFDGSAWQPLTTADWTSTSTAGAAISGSGTSTDPLIITGSRSEVNDALANMQMIPDLDWTTSPSVPTSGCFALHHTVTRTDDSVVIAQNDVPGDETGEETEVRTEFDPGTAVDAITVPSTLYYYGSPEILGPGDEVSTISYINDWVSALTEETAAYHGVDYSLSFYTHSNPDISLNGVLLDADYMEDGYVDDQYIAVQYYWNNKTQQEINNILNGFQITNWSADFYMGIRIFRSDDLVTPLFNQNTYFEYVSFPLIQSTPLVVNSPIESYSNSYDADYDETYRTQSVDYLNYTYGGAGTIVYNSVNVDAWKSSSRKTSATFTTEPSQYNVTFEPSNNRLKIEFNYVATDNIDTDALFLDEEFKVGISGLTPNPVYQKLYVSRYLSSREELLRGHYDTSFGTSDPVYSYPDAFFPVAYDKPDEIGRVTSVVENSSVAIQAGGSQWAGGYFVPGSQPNADTLYNAPAFVYTDDNIMGEYYLLFGHPDPNWAAYQAGIGDPGLDHLFVAHPYQWNGTKQIVFSPADLQTTDDILTTDVDYDNVVANRIPYDTGWTADSKILDVLFDDVGLKFYALIGNQSTRDWQLVSVECLNGLVLNVVAGATLEASGTGPIVSGAVGRTTENDIFISLAYNNGLTPTVDFRHSDIGWNIKDTISLNSSQMLGYMYSTSNKNICANIKGYFAAGLGLWKYNTITGSWDMLQQDDRIVFPSHTFIKSNALDDSARIALTPDFWVDAFGRITRLDTVTTGFRPDDFGSLYQEDDHVPRYDDPVAYSQQDPLLFFQYHFNGSKHGNVFISKNTSRTMITRFTN